jgi:hypothetical protein
MTGKTLLSALGVGVVVGLLLGIGLVGLNGPTPDTVFVHHATPKNISGNSTYLHNPLTEGSLNVVLVVTPNWKVFDIAS